MVNDLLRTSDEKKSFLNKRLVKLLINLILGFIGKIDKNITADNNTIAVGDEIASFTSDGTQDITFSKVDLTGVKHTGEHTETLTFNISIGN